MMSLDPMSLNEGHIVVRMPFLKQIVETVLKVYY